MRLPCNRRKRRRWKVLGKLHGCDMAAAAVCMAAHLQDWSELHRSSKAIL
jgi:hypothetical protein